MSHGLNAMRALSPSFGKAAGVAWIGPPVKSESRPPWTVCLMGAVVRSIPMPCRVARGS